MFLMLSTMFLTACLEEDTTYPSSKETTPTVDWETVEEAAAEPSSEDSGAEDTGA